MNHDDGAVALSIGRCRWYLTILALAAALPAVGQPVGGEGGLSEYSVRKAEHLLRDRLSCLGCHSLRGEGGSIGPDLSTVRERRSPAYIAAMIDDPQGVVPGSAMPRPRLDASTRVLIVRYLQHLPGDAEAAPPPAVSASQAAATPNGPALYARWCAACHGAEGKGNGPNAARLPVLPAPHIKSGAMSARSDDALYDTIAGGGAIMNRSPRMPAFGGSLSPAEIRALVAHIRALCKCRGPAWSRDGAGVVR